MENAYRIKKNTVIIDVVYKKKVVEVEIDKEDLPKAQGISGKWILIKKNMKTDIFYIVCNKDKKNSLHKLVLEATPSDTVYFREKTYTNLKKSNLSLNTYETDDDFRAKRRKSYEEMSEKGRENLLNGIRKNRFSKEWIDKLAETKTGVKNHKAIITPEIVKEIRSLYALKTHTQQTIADYFQIGRTTVADIINYRTWNEIGEDKKKTYRMYNENQLLFMDIRGVPIEFERFTSLDLPFTEFTLHLRNKQNEEYMFIQMIGDIKLYIEIRKKDKTFFHSFEVVFPEFLTNLHIHNYVITQKKPGHYMNRHDVHHYMSILSTYLFSEHYAERVSKADYS